MEFSSSTGRSYRDPGVQDILEFLQSGLDLALSISTLKVQVSALSAFFGTSWTVHPLIRPVLQRGPRFPKWDLFLVLDSLAGLNTTGTDTVSIIDPSTRVAFLVAITSAKRVSEIGSFDHKEPFLTFFPDRVVLIPMLGSNPKVTSVFHEDQEIVLSTFRAPGAVKAHPLDVGEILKEYLKATSSFRCSDPPVYPTLRQ